MAIEYTVRGRPGATDAVLLHVDDAEVIEEIRVDRPFGFYVGELPERARDIVTTRFDEHGKRMWQAEFYRPDYRSRRRPPDFQGRSKLRG